MTQKDSPGASINVIILALFLAPACAGQTSTPAPAAGSRKTADLVSVLFTADDGHGTPITSLNQDSFRFAKMGGRRPSSLSAWLRPVRL